MERYARVLGVMFGVMMISLSLAVTAETLLRKFFSFSLGGIDELGGYAIAIAAPLSFTVALIERSHIRISQLSQHFPRKAQAVLDVAAVVSLALLAIFFFYFTVRTVGETRMYRSIAQTPWATPLIWPQTIWLITSVTFPLAGIILSAQAVRMLLRRDWNAIHKAFGTVSAEEELEAELEDLKRREADIHTGTGEATQ